MAAGNGDEVLIKINGDSKGAVDAIRGATQTLNDITNTMRTVSQMAQTMGAAFAQSGQAWLASSKNAEEYRARLNYLQAQMANFNQTQKQSGEGAQGLQFNLQSLGDQIFKNMGSFGAFALTANSVLGVIGEIGGAVGGVIDTFMSFADTIANVVVGALRMAGQEFANLTEQAFELNKTTEQATGSWRYIYGGGGPGAQQMTEGIMNWSSKFAFNIPYTRQDLHDAITALGRAGLSADTVEQYMPDIADLGALNPQRNLTQAAWSIQGAMHGYSRMLKYDYGINPEELYDFGYDENNAEATLLPALRAYLHARGMTGAAAYAAQHTFWGAESSFVDRLQNFGLEVGGTALNGDIAPNSMFGGLKTDLTGLSSWWDKHSKQINQVADLLKNVLGGAVKDLTALFQGLADGLHKSGLDKLLENIVDSFGKWLNDPATQAGMKAFGDVFGQLGGTLVSTGLQAAGQFFDALGRTGVPQAAFNSIINMFNTISDFFKNHKQDINDFFFRMGTFTGKGLQDIGDAFKHLGEAFKNFKNSLTPEQWNDLKLFFESAMLSTVKEIADVIAFIVDRMAEWVSNLAKVVSLFQRINELMHPGSGDGGGGAPGGGGGGGSKMMSVGVGATSYTASTSNNTSLHFYGAGAATVASVTNKLLDERDRGSYLAKHTPGGLNTLGILG